MHLSKSSKNIHEKYFVKKESSDYQHADMSILSSEKH